MLLVVVVLLTEQNKRGEVEMKKKERSDMTDEDYSLFNYFVETITIGMVITDYIKSDD